MKISFTEIIAFLIGSMFNAVLWRIEYHHLDDVIYPSVILMFAVCCFMIEKFR